MLSPSDVVYLLENKQYELIWTAIKQSSRFPVTELVAAKKDLSLLYPLFNDSRMTAQRTMTLVDDVILHRAPKPESIISKLATSFLHRRVRLFQYCMCSTKNDSLLCMTAVTPGCEIDYFLNEACMRDRLPTTKALLTMGANPNDTPKENLHPLDNAVKINKIEAVRALVESPLFTSATVQQDNIRRTRGELNKLIHVLTKQGKITVVR